MQKNITANGHRLRCAFTLFFVVVATLKMLSHTTSPVRKTMVFPTQRTAMHQVGYLRLRGGYMQSEIAMINHGAGGRMPIHFAGEYHGQEIPRPPVPMMDPQTLAASNSLLSNAQPASMNSTINTAHISVNLSTVNTTKSAARTTDAGKSRSMCAFAGCSKRSIFAESRQSAEKFCKEHRFFLSKTCIDILVSQYLRYMQKFP
jgi:hypothetical protein